MKRAITYLSLWLEIASATCRWVATGRRIGWRMFVARILRQAKFIPAPSPSRFQRAQPESIQQCLKFDQALLEKTYRSRTFRPEEGPPYGYSWKLPKDWADKKELDEDGYLKKST